MRLIWQEGVLLCLLISAKIYIRSGKGGDGHVGFRRELYRS